MCEINDQYSDTSSGLNWPLDDLIERQQHDRVVFENVADQYVKGEDVTAFFTILHDIKVNPDEDQIGLLRVGCTNVKKCVAYAPIQFNSTIKSGSIRHGTATFPSTIPVTDDEFYQFCYIINKTKNLGSSIPFQLNCALDDIDLLLNASVGKTKTDGLIALDDNDNNDIVVIHSKRMLIEEKLRQENRHLLDMHRRLELQKNKCQAKLDLSEVKTKGNINQICNDMQTLNASHKTAIDKLSFRQQSETKLCTEHDACRSFCHPYQAGSSQYAERGHIIDTNQIRSQLAVTLQLTKDQATQIIDLERRLMQSNQLSKTSNQRQALLEQQLRDSLLTFEKYQISMQAQLDEYSKRAVQQDDQINALKTANSLLKEELNSLKTDNKCLSLISKQDKELLQKLQQQLDQLRKQHREENELAQNKIESLRTQLNEMNLSQQAYMNFKTSFTEIEKRCVKHQKSEIEVKRQLGVYQKFVNDLQREIQDLTKRLSVGAEEYKTLLRKYTSLERTMGINYQQGKLSTTRTNESVILEKESISVPRNTYKYQEEKKEDKNNQENEMTSTRISSGDIQVEIVNGQCVIGNLLNK